MIVYCPRCGAQVMVVPEVRSVMADVREQGISSLVVEFDITRPDHHCKV